MASKVCKNCKIEFNATHGNALHCSKICRSAFAAHRYRITHKDEIKQYWDNNKEKIKARRRQYYIDNKKSIIRKVAEWAANNPVKIRANQANFHEKRRKRNKSACSECGDEFILVGRRDKKTCSIKCQLKRSARLGQHRDISTNYKVKKEYIRKGIDELSDWYIKSLYRNRFGVSVNDIIVSKPNIKNLLEIKRSFLKLKRLIKTKSIK